MLGRFLSLFVVVAVTVSCGASQAPLRKAGETCEAREECEAGLVCKAARCGPLESPAGGACVTERGCGAGLACIRGRCSVGRATAGDCETACAHLATLYRHEVVASLVPGEADAAALEKRLGPETGAGFATDCAERCLAGSTREHAACLAGVERLDEVRDCN